MKKRITALLLAIMLVCSLAAPVSAALNKDIRNSVVVVRNVFAGDSGTVYLGQGTGFFINDQYLITNHHVIEDYLVLGEGEETVGTFDDGTGNAFSLVGRAKIRVHYDSNDYEEGYLVRYDEHRDIAILRLDAPTTKREPLSLKIPTEEMFGAEVYAVGFPGLSEKGDATEKWGRNDASATGGSISRLFTESGTGVQTVQVDFEFKPGNSGGPVVTADGDVVGIVRGFRVNEYAQSFSYAINVQELILMLNQYDIPYTMATAAPDPTAPVEPEPEPDNTMLIVGIAVAAVLVVAVIVIVVLKKKKPAPAPVPAAPVLNPTIRSYAQANYGMSAVVTTQPMLIGRNNVCALRFPANTPGISGSHCSVQWDPAMQVFVVTDLNSTYGTYLMSGQRMQPNQPYRMRAGDKFYLGEQGNIISLTME